MGIMNRLSDLFKGENEYVDEFKEGYDEEENEQELNTPSAPSAKISGGLASTTSLEMKVCKPEKYEDVTKIATHLLERRTVVLNLEDANKETIIRIIDFLFGVTFAINGQLKRVASSTYVITPPNVEVTGEQKEAEGMPGNTTGAKSKPRELF
ncbi:MAG: cell division protein SepF [Clostridiales bacterium]|jgi:cell division inhibitor SepF|nr:cell division protein SepF [Clostridiales bacterium]